MRGHEGVAEVAKGPVDVGLMLVTDERASFSSDLFEDIPTQVRVWTATSMSGRYGR